jgi:tRNA dimethylallyltransferase
MTELFRNGAGRPLEGFRVSKIGTNPEREALASRIEARTRKMFNSGLIEEVRHILSLGFSPDSKALQSIGYREAVHCIRGQLTIAEAIEHTVVATRQYAKRQRTWFRREPGILWLPGFGSQEEVQNEAIHHLEVGLNYS